jgi:hypothetical protein
MPTSVTLYRHCESVRVRFVVLNSCYVAFGLSITFDSATSYLVVPDSFESCRNDKISIGHVWILCQQPIH